jgi:hypothetical protein
MHLFITLKMKKLPFILIIFLLFSCGQLKTPEQKEAESKANAALLVLVFKEPKVIDATVTPADVLYISVKSDGTNRNAYADYFCNLIKESKSKVRWVKIIEVGTSNAPNANNAYGILLGESHCEFLD